MITADYHVHSLFSSDSDTPMEAMVEKAVSLGMERICFTDHMDYDFPKQYGLSFQFDPERYFEKLAEITEKYKHDIKVLKGIELGMMPHLGSRYHKLLLSYPFDFVIASIHLVDGMDPYYPEFWERYSLKEGFQRYFDSILESITVFQDFDVYGHLDYIGRYALKYHGDFRLADFQEKMDQILTALISYGKGIEVNTAGYKYGMGHPNPHEDTIKRYLALGGKILTIGSDGHKPEHFAYDFGHAETVLRSIHVKEYMVFEHRKPISIPL